MERCDVLISGTGSLAEGVLFALSTTAAREPLHIGIAGRNAERLNWLTTAANGRASAFGLPNYTRPIAIDWDEQDALATMLSAERPRVIIQTASMQSPWTLGAPNAWARMIAAGGYGLATPLHTILTARLLEALRAVGHEAAVINGTFPDIANSILECLGYPSPVGFGNIDIVAVSVMAVLGERDPGAVQALGQYEPHVAAFRLAPEQRGGMSPRVWHRGVELADFQTRMAGVRFPGVSDDGLNRLTGTTAVPMALAYLTGATYLGHATGPFGLPGGYPVRIEGGTLTLRLPDGVGEAEAIAYNKRFEEHEGIVVDTGAKRVTLSGKARSSLERHDPRLAEGYSVKTLAELEAAGRDLLDLRLRLENDSA